MICILRKKQTTRERFQISQLPTREPTRAFSELINTARLPFIIICVNISRLYSGRMT